MSTRPGGMYSNTPPIHTTKPIDAPGALVGRVLDGRYQLNSIMSTGGMGIIFEATQLSVSRRIAVKILRPTLANDVDLLQRFSQEVEVVASISHPNIVALIDAGQDATGLMFLVMEFIKGETFRDALKSSRLKLVDIIEVFMQICEALGEAHAIGIIHRDLKFDNIMLQERHDQRLHIKILDFGVAKLLTRNVNLTRGGQIPGTPGIIAPELVAMKDPSPQSDLYSLGVLLFTALTGQAPFQGKNDLELMHAHQFEPVPDITPLVQSYTPEPLVELVKELMSKEPSNRPHDAMAVRRRLETIQRTLQSEHRDLPAYVPPLFEKDHDIFGSGAFRLQPGQAAQLDDFEGIELPREVKLKPSKQPLLVVPASVVTMLALVLLVLCVILLYMLRGLLFG